MPCAGWRRPRANGQSASPPRPPLSRLRLPQGLWNWPPFPFVSLTSAHTPLRAQPSHPHVKSAGQELGSFEDYRRSLRATAKSPVTRYFLTSGSGKLWWVYLWQLSIKCRSSSIPRALTSKRALTWRFLLASVAQLQERFRTVTCRVLSWCPSPKLSFRGPGFDRLLTSALCSEHALSVSPSLADCDFPGDRDDLFYVAKVTYCADLPTFGEV